MPLLHAIVLGITQGLTEFLPISSSGHLILVPWLFGWNDLSDPGIEKAFDVALHAGTLIAVTGYFRHEVWTYVRAGIGAIVHRRQPTTPDGRIALLLVWSCVPASVAGALLQTWIDDTLGGPVVIALSLIGFAVVLGMADRRRETKALEQVTLREATVIGVAQVLALNPGTSRSGITISAGRFLGLDRWSAARFSFLMSLPVTLGAVLVKVAGLVSDGMPQDLMGAMIAGIVASAISGWFAVSALLRLIRTRSFDVFVLYRVIAGISVLGIAASAWR